MKNSARCNYILGVNAYITCDLSSCIGCNKKIIEQITCILLSCYLIASISNICYKCISMKKTKRFRASGFCHVAIRLKLFFWSHAIGHLRCKKRSDKIFALCNKKWNFKESRGFKTMCKLGFAGINSLDDYLLSSQTRNTGALSRTGNFHTFNS